MPKQINFTVPQEYDNVNALTFLRKYCGLSSRMITRLKREKDGILQDGKILRTVDAVFSGSIVQINMPDEKINIVPIAGNPDILYEDSYIFIANKPPFMPVHPVKQHQSDTLANIISFYSMQKGESFTFRAINRLDKDTSGAVFIAKDRFIANQVKFSLYKTYYAICEGFIKEGGTIDAPIALKKDSKMIREITPDGAKAVTHYKVIKSNEKYSFLEITLETGRTHQIRCHMSSIGFPLAGDDMYGGSLEKIPRQALHCGKISFTHPITKEEITVNAKLPDDMQNIVDEI